MDAKRVRESCKQKDKLVEKKKHGQSRMKRLDGGGRKAVYDVMEEIREEILFDWVTELRSRNIHVSRRMIVEKANGFTFSNNDFKASRGWFQIFMKCKGLSLRRKQLFVKKHLPTVYQIPKLVSFITHLRKLKRCHKFTKECTDETACWFDMPSDTTVATTGSRSVPVKTTGHEKDHYTVILTARRKCSHLKYLKGKEHVSIIKELEKISIVVQLSCKGWMNDSLTSDYLKKVLGQLSFRKRCL